MSEHKLAAAIAHLKKTTFRRVLGVLDLFAIGYGDLGSSIYYALGITALFALGATPIALLLAGIVFICTVLTYAEMTSMLHDSGGSATFARHAFNDLISFIAGWGLLLDYIVTIAISAVAVGPYLSYFFSDLNQVPLMIGFTVALIILLFVMNVFRVTQSTRISFLLTAATILVQGVIIVIGLSTLLNLSLIFDHMRINVAGAGWSPTWAQFWKGTAMAMVAYTGIESIAQLGAEAKRPIQTIPRALLTTMTFLCVIYLGISVVALSTVTPFELGTTYLLNPIAAIVDGLPYGKALLSPCIAAIAAIVLTVASNAGLLGASRLSFNMAQHHQLPQAFSYVHPRFRTPLFSLGFFALIAILIVLVSRAQLTFLADLYNFGAMLAFLSAHLSLIALRIKKPELKRPFKIRCSIPFGPYSIPVTAIIGALATFSVWCLVVITKPEGRWLGIAWMIGGIAVYYLHSRKKVVHPFPKIEPVKLPEFKPVKIEHILVPMRTWRYTEAVQMACQMAKLHQAKLTVLQVVQIPLSLPPDSPIPHLIQRAAVTLQHVEQIASEFDVEIEYSFVRSRSIADSILEAAKLGGCDLIVLGESKHVQLLKTKGIGAITETILRRATCRVMVCTTGFR